MTLFSFEWFQEQAGYSGNIQADMVEEEMEHGVSVQERFLCTCCASVVSASQWVEKYQACEDCTSDFLEKKENSNVKLPQ